MIGISFSGRMELILIHRLLNVYMYQLADPPYSPRNCIIKDRRDRTYFALWGKSYI